MSPIRMGITFRRVLQNGTVIESELDHLLTTCPQKVVKHRVEDFSHASDHDAILAEIEFNRQKQKPVKKTARDLRRLRENPELLKRAVAKFPLESILFKQDVNDMVNQWTTFVRARLDEVAPVKTKTLKSGKKRPHLDQETVSLIAERKRLRKEVLKRPQDEELLENYKKCRNRCNNLIKIQQRKAMGRYLTEESSMNEVWKHRHKLGWRSRF